MDNLGNMCVQNFLGNLTVKEFWNRSTFAEVMIKRQVYCFFWDSVYGIRIWTSKVKHLLHIGRPYHSPRMKNTHKEGMWPICKCCGPGLSLEGIKLHISHFVYWLFIASTCLCVIDYHLIWCVSGLCCPIKFAEVNVFMRRTEGQRRYKGGVGRPQQKFCPPVPAKSTMNLATCCKFLVKRQIWKQDPFVT